MVQISIISVGTLKESYLREAVVEYKKRLMQYARVEEINIKEETIKNESNGAEIKRALDAEGEKILAAVPTGAYRIALCVEGKEYTSPELARALDAATAEKGKISFIIGSSHGLSENVKKQCDMRLSVSKMTFPHQLMRVILFEALYRSFTIIAGKKYHK